MYLCIYIHISMCMYIYRCIHTHMYTCTNVYMYIHMYINIYIYMFINICMYVYVCTYIYICMYVYMCMFIHKHTHVCIFICIYMYIHIYIYICPCYIHICKRRLTVLYFLSCLRACVSIVHYHALQHTATQCNTLQHTQEAHTCTPLPLLSSCLCGREWRVCVYVGGDNQKEYRAMGLVSKRQQFV